MSVYLGYNEITKQYLKSLTGGSMIRLFVPLKLSTIYFMKSSTEFWSLGMG